MKEKKTYEPAEVEITERIAPVFLGTSPGMDVDTDDDDRFGPIHYWNKN